MYRRFGSRLSCGFCVCGAISFFLGVGRVVRFGKFCLISFLFYFIFIHQFCMSDACAFFVCLVLGWCACGCVELIGSWRDVFPFYFCYFSSTVKKSAVPGNLNRSRLPWPFGRVNVAAAFVFFFFIGLPYDTSTIQPAVHQILALFIQQEFHTSNFTSMILIQ